MIARLRPRSDTTYLIHALAVMAGIFYCSWPLEYWINPTVAHRHGLASELGAAGQPYAWLFDATDIIACLLIFSTVFLLLRLYRFKGWLGASLIGYASFGVLTIVDALLPLDCLPSSGTCGDVLRNPLIVAHGVTSITASLALFVSAVCCWVVALKSDYRKIHAMMYAVLWGYMIFGLLSLLFIFVKGPGYLTQDYFIILTSVWIALLPFVLLQLKGPVTKKGLDL